MTANPLLEIVGFIAIVEISRRHTLASLPMNEALSRGSRSRASFLFQNAFFSFGCAIALGVMMFGGVVLYGLGLSFAWYFVPIVVAMATGLAVGNFQYWANPQQVPGARRTAPQPVPIAVAEEVDPEDDTYEND